MRISIPNTLTLSNLFAGCLGIYFVFHDRPRFAILSVGFSLLFDYLDGFVARLLNQSDPIGKQLDSLADVVSFGVVPGCMLFQMISTLDIGDTVLSNVAPFFAFLFPVFGARRLAKFNLDTRSADYFYGLPIPSAAIFIVGLYWISVGEDCASCASVFINPYTLFGCLLVLCYLMVSDLPHFNLKFRGLTWKGQEVKWIYILVILASILFLKKVAIPLAIALYIFFSLGFYGLRSSD